MNETKTSFDLNEYKSLFNNSDNFNNSLKKVLSHLSAVEAQTNERLLIIENFLDIMPKLIKNGKISEKELRFTNISNFIKNSKKDLTRESNGFIIDNKINNINIKRETLKRINIVNENNFEIEGSGNSSEEETVVNNKRNVKNEKDKNDNVSNNAKNNLKETNNKIESSHNTNLNTIEKNIVKEIANSDDFNILIDKKMNEYYNNNNKDKEIAEIMKTHINKVKVEKKIDFEIITDRENIDNNDNNENNDIENKKNDNYKENTISKDNNEDGILKTKSDESEKKERKERQNTKVSGNYISDDRVLEKLTAVEETIFNFKKELASQKQQIHRLGINKYDVSENVKNNQEIGGKFDQLSLELNDLKATFGIFQNSFDDVKIKVMDFNIYDQMGKSSGNSNDNSDFSQILTIVKNLDSKTFKKFEFYDNRFKEVDNMQRKIISETQTFPKNLDETNKDLDALKKNFTKNDLYQNDMNKILDDKQKDLEKTISNLKEINNALDKRVKKIENDKNQDNKSESEYSKKKTNRGIGYDELYEDPKFKALVKKIAEIEKLTNQYLNGGIVDQLNDRLDAQKAKILQKADVGELKDIREAFSSLVGQIEYLKDEIVVLSETRKLFEEITFINRKVDQLSNNLNALKLSENDGKNKNVKSHQSIDTSKFVDFSYVNEFKDSFKNDLKSLEYNILNMKRLFEEMNTVLMTKAGETDLKAAEDYFLAKLEESKALSLKRFSERIDTNKNFKYLDSLIKSLQEQFNKKIDKPNENWLLAKRPMDSYTCASCEGYIGELKDKNNNKKGGFLPNLNEDKVYRSGVGYSKLLELLGDNNQENSSHNQGNINNLSLDIRSKKVLNDGLSKSHYNNLNNKTTVTGKKNNNQNSNNLSTIKQMENGNENNSNEEANNDFKIGNDSKKINFSDNNDNKVVKIVKVSKNKN